MKFNSLSNKLAVYTALLVFVLVGLGTYELYDEGRAITLSQADRLSDEIASHYSESVSARLEEPLRVAGSLSDAIIVLYRSKVVERAIYNDLLRKTLEGNRNYLNVWVGFERNTVGQDADNIGCDGCDATGRHLASWYMENGKAKVEAWKDPDENRNAEGFWHTPKRTGKPIVTEPYSYKLGGKDVLVVSLVTPILVDGKFLGVVGVDFDLATVWTMLKDIRPFDSGRIYLISNGGKWAGYPNAEQFG